MSASPSAVRIEKTRAAMREKDLPALLVSQIDNVGWLSGFTGSSGFVIVTQSDALFATDSRYVEQARTECAGLRQTELATSAPEEIAGILADLHEPKIGFEAAHVSYRLYQEYREKLPPETEFASTNRLVDDLRLVKDEDEIALIESACGLADRAWEHIISFLKPGAVERDVMLELEWFMRKEGGGDVGFPSIVASGPRSALPHGRASSRVMHRGDFVTLDFGARLNSYCSDITRTVVLGQPNEEQRKVYATVLEAQQRGIDAAVAGDEGRAVDSVARDFIAAAGYGDYFRHGLGHSLGRAVHDGPGLSKRSDITLAPGMVMTVEPGIYKPDWGGVRIEDDILVTTGAPRVLTHAPKDLLVL